MLTDAIDDYLTKYFWIMGPWRPDDGQCHCTNSLSETLQAKPSMLTLGRYAWTATARSVQ